MSERGQTIGDTFRTYRQLAVRPATACLARERGRKWGHTREAGRVWRRCRIELGIHDHLAEGRAGVQAAGSRGRETPVTIRHRESLLEEGEVLTLRASSSRTLE